MAKKPLKNRKGFWCVAGIMSKRPTAAASKNPPVARDTSIETYRAKRNFGVTCEPAPEANPAAASTLIFVVQKHDATRLHYDFRLEHDGVLWSWAIPKGPSLDPHDKRLAVHVEDHPRDYATFAGTIPAGNYGAGTVEIWDRGTWSPIGDPVAAMAKGEMKFVLAGERLHGQFVFIRLKPRPKEKAENWLLIKEHDAHEQPGGTVEALEAIKLKPASRAKTAVPAKSDEPPPPAAGAVRAPLPHAQAPQLAAIADAPPIGADWISEVKFDGYRLLAWVRAGKVTLLTRNGLDWTARLSRVAAALTKLKLTDGLLDGELVALRDDGVSSFSQLQAALSDGRDKDLFFYLFDLLHQDGWDLRGCAQRDRKRLLKPLNDWRGTLRYSDHIEADGERLHKQACGMGLEGIICKQADAPYKAGRGGAWLKVKCQGREEFVILGWTDPEGHRTGLGSLQFGFYDPSGQLHYIGGVGTGFSAKELSRLRLKLDALASAPPASLLFAGNPPDRGIHWARPELVAEVSYIGWSGAGRLRHASYLGLREDKHAPEVVRDIPDAQEARIDFAAARGKQRIVAVPPRKPSPAKSTAAAPAKPMAATVTAKAPKSVGDLFEGVRLTHPDKELWPGISKLQLAEYWRAVAAHAVPEIANRPLALVRCPDGIAGQHFFQKHGGAGTAQQIREGAADGAPYLAITAAAGLYAAAQMSAIELHSWGSSLADPLHPDRLVFDLDPGDGVTMPVIVAAAHDVRDRLAAIGLKSWCRTSGGKGLHVVVPLRPQADWPTTRAWCRAFAETMEREAPERYVASVSKKKREGRILVDWLRNGLGSTAVASFCPRARPGAGVATPLDWKEVTPKLDIGQFTLKTVPQRLAKQTTDPWKGFLQQTQTLPASGGASKKAA